MKIPTSVPSLEEHSSRDHSAEFIGPVILTNKTVVPTFP